MHDGNVSGHRFAAVMRARRTIALSCAPIALVAAAWVARRTVHWSRTPYPILLHEDHAAELTAFAQRVLAGDVGTQPDPRNGFLLAKCMVGYDVHYVMREQGCVLVRFYLPWFDGPIYSLIYEPPGETMPGDERDPKRWQISEVREFGDGWTFVSKDVLEPPR